MSSPTRVRHVAGTLAPLVCLLVFAACGRVVPPLARPSVAPAADDPEWHYAGDEGPDHWAELSPRFTACRDGRRQSPIDITSPARLVPPALQLQFPPASLRIAHHEHVADGINNGHTIQINYDDGDTLIVGETPYELVQYHFHNPSEHTLGGQHAPMEMHMVHRSAAGGLAVVAVFIEEGRHNSAFDPVWTNLPRARGVEVHYEHVMIDVDALLPPLWTSYRYDGSLTTPPCTEGVRWIVLTMPIELDADQIRAFTVLVHDNNRPVQPLNARAVITDTVAEAP
jgi:carbonic anhydrase